MTFYFIMYQKGYNPQEPFANNRKTSRRHSASEMIEQERDGFGRQLGLTYPTPPQTLGTARSNRQF